MTARPAPARPLAAFALLAATLAPPLSAQEGTPFIGRERPLLEPEALDRAVSPAFRARCHQALLDEELRLARREEPTRRFAVEPSSRGGRCALEYQYRRRLSPRS